MEAESGRCYILTETCIDTREGCEIRLFAVDDTGPLLLRFTRQEPLFFLRRDDRALPSGARRAPLELTSFAGEPLDGIYFSSLRGFYNGRQSLREQGVHPLESDIRPEERFLMERFIHRSLEYRGLPARSRAIRELIDPAVRSTEYRPPFSSLSLDIETGPDREVYCVGCHYRHRNGDEAGSVHMVGPESPAADATDFELYYYPDEAAMLAGALNEIRRADPDLIIGWNVIGFDLRRLEEAFSRANIQFALGRDGSPPRIFQKQSGMRSAEVAGRIVLDGPQVLRGGFFRFENYTLDTVANELLGSGKIIQDEQNKFAEIIRRFSEDKTALARYNFEDCRLVSRIFETSGVTEQYITRSLVTGLRLDKVSMSVAAFDFFYLPRLHREGYAAPDIADIQSSGHAAGGHVFTSDPGLYPHVAVLDFKSLYPSIILTFGVDPLSRLTAADAPRSTPAGIEFNRTRSILPDHISTLLERRAAARRSGDETLSQAVKILMNSFYGVMGTPGCRFYHPDLPTAITASGQWILKETTALLRNRGYKVLYGDTDSVFVQLKKEEFSHVDEAARGLAELVNSEFRRRLELEFGTVSHLELEYEKQYNPFFLAPMRSGTEGARKRYVGRLAVTGEIEFRGMETVRSDWTRLARDFQRELFRRFFDGGEIPGWLTEYVRAIRAGNYDRRLVYRRRLTKHSREYTRNAPPHVRAARMLDPEETGNIRSVEYLMTPEGPVPLQLKPEKLDYDHYIEKQIKPIADGVLPFLNTSFDEIIEGKQLELF